MEQHPTVGLVYTPVLFVKEDGRMLGRDKERCYSGEVFNKLVVNNFVRNSTPVILKQCFDKAGLFDESLFYSADWDMWLRISRRFPVAYIPTPLSKYRRRGYDYLVKNTEKVKAEMVWMVEKIFCHFSIPRKVKVKTREDTEPDFILDSEGLPH